MVFLRGRLGRPTAKKFDFAGSAILGIDFEEYVIDSLPDRFIPSCNSSMRALSRLHMCNLTTFASKPGLTLPETGAASTRAYALQVSRKSQRQERKEYALETFWSE